MPGAYIKIFRSILLAEHISSRKKEFGIGDRLQSFCTAVRSHFRGNIFILIRIF